MTHAHTSRLRFVTGDDPSRFFSKQQHTRASDIRNVEEEAYAAWMQFASRWAGSPLRDASNVGQLVLFRAVIHFVYVHRQPFSNSVLSCAELGNCSRIPEMRMVEFWGVFMSRKCSWIGVMCRITCKLVYSVLSYWTHRLPKLSNEWRNLHIDTSTVKIIWQLMVFSIKINQ